MNNVVVNVDDEIHQAYKQDDIQKFEQNINIYPSQYADCLLYDTVCYGARKIFNYLMSQPDINQIAHVQHNNVFHVALNVYRWKKDRLWLFDQIINSSDQNTIQYWLTANSILTSTSIDQAREILVGNCEIAKNIIITLTSDIRIKIPPFGERNCDIFTFACQEGMTELVAVLLNRPDVSVRSFDGLQ